MIDPIKELISLSDKKGFIAHKIVLECQDCGYSKESTYYDLLKDKQYELLEPTTVPNPYIQESYYEEDVTATPIKFKMECPECKGEMLGFSPVPMEYILNHLSSPPPDDIIYG